MTERTPDGLNRRTYLKFAGGAAASAALAGCSGDGVETETPIDDGDGMDGDDGTDTPEPQEDFEVTVTQSQMATTLDPHNHRETSTDNILLQAYDRVVFRDAEGRIIERLATDWDRVEDGHVRYQLRDDVTFHNGDDLTPEDVAYSIRRVVDPETDFESPQRDQLAGIVDAEADPDANAVHVYSDGLNPMAFQNQASYCMVVQQDWIESRESSEIAQEINGTGPFELVDYEEDVSVSFEAFDGFWGETPDADAVTVNAAGEPSSRVNGLLAGETDLAVNIPPDDAPRVEDNDAASIGAVPSTRVLFLVMNDVMEPFTDRSFRQAMNYAIDLESMIDNILRGFGDPTGQPTLEGYVGHADDVEPYPHDPDEAESLIEESGFAGAELELHTPVDRYLGDVNLAQAAAGYIDDLSNVSAEVNQRDFATLAGELLDGDQSTSPAFFLIGWGNTTFDASQTLLPWLIESGSISHFSDDEIAATLDEASSESDPDARAQLLSDVNRRAHELAPMVFLHRQYSVYGVSDRIEWEPRQDEQISVEEFEQA